MNKKCVLVTGATGNLGKAVVEVFFDAGYEVIGLYHRTKPVFQTKASYYQCDLGDEAETDGVLKSILEKQQIDVAVLTAGGFEMNSIKDANLEAVRRMMSLNFETAYTVSRTLFNHMHKHRAGKIFFVGSQQGSQPARGTKSLAYTLSKSLLFALAEVLNEEAKTDGVTVEVVVPTVIDTPQNRESMPNADTSKWQKPTDIAQEILRKTS